MAGAKPDPRLLQPHLDAGHDLIPLRRRGKAPEDQRWTTRDYRSFDAAAHMAGGGNVGVRLGERDLVVDVDPRRFPDGETLDTDNPLRRLAAATGLDVDAAPTVETGSGGLHLYLRKPEGARLLDEPPGYPGVELKTRGRQVVAAGSVHPDTGRLYRLDPLSSPLASAPDAPEALLVLAEKAQAPEGEPERGWTMSPDELGRVLDGAPSPDGYDEWLRGLMAMHAVTAGEGLAQAQAWSWDGCKDVVAAKWAGFSADGGVGWGTLREVLAGCGAGRAVAEMDRLERGDPAAQFDEPPDAPAAAEGRPPGDVMAGWVFVADAMKFIRRRDLKQFRPDQWNSLFASLDPEHNLVSRVYKGKTPVRRYESLAYVPRGKEELPRSTYNIWRPSGVEAREGDVSVIEEHLAYLFPDETERGHVLDFMHFVCVRPEVKLMFAPIIQGKQGTGKTALGVLLRRIIGEANVAEPSPDELKERWSKWQEGASLALVEELMTNGRMELANKLKPVITNDTLRIEDKGAPLYSIPNHLNMLCFTNHKNAIRLEEGDRRWLVLFSPAEPRGNAYYRRLWGFVESREGPAAWRHRLEQHRPALDPKGRAPHTAAKDEAREASMTDVESTVAEWVASRTGPLRNDLFRFEDAWARLDRSSRPHKAALTMALRAAGCVQHPRQTNPGLPAVTVWSVTDHERWAAASAAERTRAWMEMEGYESIEDFEQMN